MTATTLSDDVGSYCDSVATGAVQNCCGDESHPSAAPVCAFGQHFMQVWKGSGPNGGSFIHCRGPQGRSSGPLN